MDKGSYGRKDRLIKEKRHDTYHERQKWPEPTMCTPCGALFVNGRWTWKKSPEQVNAAVCPACRRCADNYPAGYIELRGDFFGLHRNEILNLIGNVEKQEKTERPLERIMNVAEGQDHTLVTTTGVHIARRIGEALSQSYKGELSFRYAEGQTNIRLSWMR